jgi:hypothetical protein
MAGYLSARKLDVSKILEILPATNQTNLQRPGTVFQTNAKSYVPETDYLPTNGPTIQGNNRQPISVGNRNIL